MENVRKSKRKGTEGEPAWAQLSKLKRNKLERSPDENQSGNVVRRKKTYLEDLSMNVDMEDDGMDVEEDNQGGPPLEVDEYGMRSKGRAGQLHSVRLINFMCHENLAMTFAPHINFVSGTNGSGKSAVLQAIQVCLGAKASQTGRSKNLAGFIRKGTDEAVVTTTIWNTGEDAYRYDLYGETLTVQKKIGRANTTVLKNHWGKNIGFAKDVQLMLDHLNIDATNPIAVMTQDVARTFLGGGGNSDKTKFAIYMKATQLETVQTQLFHSNQEVAESKARMEKAEETLNSHRAELQELEKVVETMREMESMQAEEVLLEQAGVWSHANQIERQLKTLVDLTAPDGKGPKRLQLATEQLEVASARLTGLEEEFAKQRESMEAYMGNIAEVNAKVTELQEAHKIAKTAALRTKKYVDRATGEKVAKEEQAKSLAESMKGTRDEEIAETQAAVSEFNQLLGEHERRRAAAVEKLQEKEAAFNEAREGKLVAARNIEDARKNVAGVQAELAEAEVRISSLRSARSKLQSFSSNVQKLVALVKQNERLFHRPPVGPIGLYLILKDPRWHMAVGEAIGGMLSNFIVHDHDDANQIRALAKRNGISMASYIQVHILNFDIPLHIIPEHRTPDQQLTTVLRVLECNDARVASVVKNIIVDAAGVESMALVEESTNQDVARTVVRSRNVKSCFTLKGMKLTLKGQSETMINPRLDRPPTFGDDLAEIRRRADDHYRLVQEKLRDAQQELAVRNQEMEVAKARSNEVREQKASLQQHKDSVQTQIDELLSQPPPEIQPAAEGADTDLDQELKELQRELWTATQKLHETTQQHEAAEATEHSTRVAFETKKKESEALMEENEATMQRLEKQEEEVQVAKTAVDHAEFAVEFLQTQLKKLEEDKEDALKRKDEFVAKAEQLCTRDVGESALASFHEMLPPGNAAEEELDRIPEILEKRLKKVRTIMRKHEERAGGSKMEIEARYNVMKLKVGEERSRLRDISDKFNKIYTSIQLRKRAQKKMETDVFNQTRIDFNNYLIKKGHLGSLQLDHEAQTLQIGVTINGSDNRTGTIKDLKQLSGGERSFTTVSFNLALGEHVSAPFRAMDEFDVFMDAVNRRIAMTSLFENALQRTDLQFIFLTPQDVGAVDDAKKELASEGKHMPEGFVKVVEMRPARTNAKQT